LADAPESPVRDAAHRHLLHASRDQRNAKADCHEAQRRCDAGRFLAEARLNPALRHADIVASSNLPRINDSTSKAGLIQAQAERLPLLIGHRSPPFGYRFHRSITKRVFSSVDCRASSPQRDHDMSSNLEGTPRPKSLLTAILIGLGGVGLLIILAVIQ
jgi:hypothetical protein